MKFGLLYPAVLRLTLPDHTTYKFDDPGLAAEFVNKHFSGAEAVNGGGSIVDPR